VVGLGPRREEIPFFPFSSVDPTVENHSPCMAGWLIMPVNERPEVQSGPACPRIQPGLRYSTAPWTLRNTVLYRRTQCF
jgi:hypothetical protein